MRCRFFFCALLVSLSSQACTLWATLSGYGSKAELLVAKNRDRQPQATTQSLKLIKARHNDDYDYIALAQGTPIAGVNASGLVVVSATIDSLPKDIRRIGQGGLVANLLAHFGSVSEVLDRGRRLLSESHRMFLLIADREQIALIEMAPNGEYQVKSINQGSAYHTNHYVFSDYLNLNPLKSNAALSSSQIRYARIKELLSSHSSPLTIQDFIQFSQEQHDGPRNSIFRLGENGSSRTIANFIVDIKAGQPMHLYLRYLPNPDPSSQNFVTREISLPNVTGAHRF